MDFFPTITIIGGGAAGFFGAIAAAEANKNSRVVLFERSGKLLAKLRISGGGRCNVTQACFDNGLLVQGYPRGYRELRGPFQQFDAQGTVDWFTARGVRLKTEPDGRMFPTTDNSETIAQCLLQSADDAGVKIRMNTGVDVLKPIDGKFELTLSNGEKMICDKVLVASGGGNKLEHFNWLRDLGHEIVPPLPSLFTFNINDKALAELSGISVENATLKITGSKLQQTGPLLITHWGVSGPAVLKLSAWGAREFAGSNYRFELVINWLMGYTEESLRTFLQAKKEENIRKNISAFSPVMLPLRLWKWILQKAEIPEETKWADCSKKQFNKLVETLLACRLQVVGKSTFKEEFVTAGGVSLKDVNLKTMESKKCPGLFFAGEVLDIDGITGGYNFQAAWTTGYISGNNINL